MLVGGLQPLEVSLCFCIEEETGPVTSNRLKSQEDQPPLYHFILQLAVAMIKLMFLYTKSFVHQKICTRKIWQEESCAKTLLSNMLDIYESGILDRGVFGLYRLPS